jgi:hypothetical protein
MSWGCYDVQFEEVSLESLPVFIRDYGNNTLFSASKQRQTDGREVEITRSSISPELSDIL